MVEERPYIAVDVSRSGETEAFMHQTLRPVLKQLNEQLLELARLYLTEEFSTSSIAERELKTDALCGSHQHFKKKAIEMITALFTRAESDFYKRHQRDIHKRIMILLKERLRSQVHKL